MRFDLRAPEFGAPAAELYRSALEMVEWADLHGFHHVRVSEHHGSSDGYCPAPLPVLAAFAARTQAVRLRVSALIVPLHDPVRLAEDLAVIDVMSCGRTEMVVAAGYRRSEFDLLGVDFAGRGVLLDDGIRVLRQAWTGEPFDWHGRRVQVRPVPVQPGGPPVFVGGSSRAAARRAARLGDGFLPTDPALYALYRQECQAIDRDPGPAPGPSGPFFLYVADDPDAARSRLEPHLRHEIDSYAGWTAATDDDLGGPRPVWTAGGQYVVVTPDEAVVLLRSLGPSGSLVLHPLVGGLDPEVAWAGLELLVGKVLPRLS
jgi:alkanesulfonate monooxygenase SsuD/methylene tetrahydromethanopterin reductase-like flavin-dependent oxidoreductase (luciferase family)